MNNDGHQSGSSIEFGPFQFDKALGRLSKHGTPVRLRGMPLMILCQVLEHPGEVVSRVELQWLLWKGDTYGDFEQGLNSDINVLRKTLIDSADQPRYIQTVPVMDYRLIAPVLFRAPISEAYRALAIATETKQGAENHTAVR